MKKATIRQETSIDHKAVAAVIEKAFANDPHSDHTEQLLVERLREDEAFIPELSLVAVVNEAVVGHILLSKVKITNNEHTVESLALAPVAVLPAYQRQGIGAQLIRAAHQKARALGFSSVVLIGHEDYYPRFGYELAGRHGITFPFDAPDENCMVKELSEGHLAKIAGQVVYPPPFLGG